MMVGPSRRYWELFITLVERELRRRTKRSLLGSVWPMIAPLFLMFLYVFVFGRVFDARVPRYPVYLMCGLLPWAFLVQTLHKTIVSLSSEPEMIRKAPLRYELIPLGAAGGHAFNFLLTVVAFVLFLGLTGELEYRLLPILVFPVAATILLVMALSMMVALIDVHTTDLRLLLGNVLTLWFFAIPIVYRPDQAPSAMHFLRSTDPMSLIVSQFRGVLYYGEIRQPEDHVLMLAITIGVFLFCRQVFRHYADDLPKDI